MMLYFFIFIEKKTSFILGYINIKKLEGQFIKAGIIINI